MDQSAGVVSAAPITTRNPVNDRIGARANKDQLTSKSNNQPVRTSSNKVEQVSFRPKPEPESKPIGSLQELLAELARLEDRRDTMRKRLTDGKQIILDLVKDLDCDLKRVEELEQFWLKLMWECRRVERRITAITTLIEPKS